ncbi:MAG: glycosyltransferase, partial [Blastocatellia bacterium]|nr:glycosyltransferase [Blastocatellia bacterium]
HSDVDICFRIWEAGFRCVYTPYATLLHIGHQSLANYDKALVADKTYKKNKATIYLLKRWPVWIARDPYYPLGMKALLYIDSPEDFDIFPGKPPRCRRDGQDILILTHELTNSGAPLVVFEIVRELINDGHFVTVMSPADGYYRELLAAEGATVIIDALLLKGHESLPRFARDFDKVIANTVVPWTAVLQLADLVDVYWYIHESKVIAKNYSIQPGFSKALHRARSVWAVSERTRQQLAHVGREIEVVEIGIQPPDQPRVAPASDAVTHFSIIGSYEDRKGQDLVVAALKMLPDDVRRRCRFQFYGRAVDPEYHSNLVAACENVAEVNLDGELSHDACLEAIQASHVVICPSRDDALNIVALEALATGRPLLCTKATGIADYLAHGESAFLVDALNPKAIAGGIIECLALKDAWPKIAENGREVFRTYFSRDAFAARLKEKLFASDTIPVA